MKYSEIRPVKCTAYPRKITKGMVEALIKAYRIYQNTKEPVKITEKDGFTFSQKTTFAHLKFWGLVYSEGLGMGYIVTRKGESFLRGEASIYNTIAEICGEVLPIDHECWDTHSSEPLLVNVFGVMNSSPEEYYQDYHEFQLAKGTTNPTLF